MDFGEVWDHADEAIRLLFTGDTELLEAACARDEVFYGGGESEGEAAKGFYIRVFGGRSLACLDITDDVGVWLTLDLLGEELMAWKMMMRCKYQLRVTEKRHITQPRTPRMSELIED